MLKIFISTYILTIIFDLSKTVIELLINFGIKENKPTRRLTAKDTAFVVPCHNSEEVIRRTLFTLPEGFTVICVANACTDGTVSLLQNLSLGTPNLVVINTAIPGKMKAVLTGILTARDMGFTEFILIDDDVIFPKKDILIHEGAVATGLPVIPLYPHCWLEVAQMIEYKYMCVSKKAQGILGNIIMCSGAAGIFNIETFLNVLKIHDGQFCGDDLQASHISHSLGYKLGFNSELAVVTEAPNTFKLWWKQRSARWECSPLYNFHWIVKTIFTSQPVGYWIRWIASYRIFVLINDIMRVISLPYVIVHFPGTLIGVWIIAYISFALKAATYYCFYKDYRYRLSSKIIIGVITYPFYSALMWVSRLWAIPSGLLKAFRRKPGGIYV